MTIAGVLGGVGNFIASIPIDAAETLIEAPTLMYGYVSGEREKEVKAQCRRNARFAKLNKVEYDYDKCVAKKTLGDVWGMTGAPLSAGVGLGMLKAPGFKALGKMKARQWMPLFAADMGASMYLKAPPGSESEINSWLKEYDQYMSTDTAENIRIKRTLGFREDLARGRTVGASQTDLMLALADRAGEGGVTHGLRAGGRIQAESREQARGNNARQTRGRAKRQRLVDPEEIREAEIDLDALERVEEEFSSEKQRFSGATNLTPEESERVRKRARKEETSKREAYKAAIRARLSDLNDVEGVIIAYATLKKKTSNRRVSARDVQAWLSESGIDNQPSRARIEELISGVYEPKRNRGWLAKNWRSVASAIGMMLSGTLLTLNRRGFFGKPWTKEEVFEILRKSDVGDWIREKHGSALVKVLSFLGFATEEMEIDDAAAEEAAEMVDMEVQADLPINVEQTKALEQNISTLADELAEVTRDRVSYLKTIEEQQQEIEALEKELHNLREGLGELEDKLGESDRENENLHELIQKEVERVEDLKKKLGETLDQLTEAQAEGNANAALLQGRAEALESELSAAQVTVQNLQIELERSNAELTDMANKYEQTENVRKMLEEQLEQKTSELQEARATIEASAAQAIEQDQAEKRAIRQRDYVLDVGRELYRQTLGKKARRGVLPIEVEGPPIRRRRLDEPGIRRRIQQRARQAALPYADLGRLQGLPDFQPARRGPLAIEN